MGVGELPVIRDVNVYYGERTGRGGGGFQCCLRRSDTVFSVKLAASADGRRGCPRSSVSLCWCLTERGKSAPFCCPLIFWCSNVRFIQRNTFARERNGLHTPCYILRIFACVCSTASTLYTTTDLGHHVPPAERALTRCWPLEEALPSVTSAQNTKQRGKGGGFPVFRVFLSNCTSVTLNTIA